MRGSLLKQLRDPLSRGGHRRPITLTVARPASGDTDSRCASDRRDEKAGVRTVHAVRQAATSAELPNANARTETTLAGLSTDVAATHADEA